MEKINLQKKNRDATPWFKSWRSSIHDTNNSRNQAFSKYRQLLGKIVQGEIKFTEFKSFKTVFLAKLILLQYCLTYTVWFN